MNSILDFINAHFGLFIFLGIFMVLVVIGYIVDVITKKDIKVEKTPEKTTEELIAQVKPGQSLGEYINKK